MGKKIVWVHKADRQLSEAFLNLLEESESLDITAKVISEIYDSVKILSDHPEIYQIDDLYRNNDGSIRAYEKHSYRVSYQVTETTIYIVELRYARKRPLKK